MKEIIDIDVEHCYMKDIYPEFDLKKAVFKNSKNIHERTINNEKYKDPDEYCLKLYKDLKRLYIDKKYKNELENEEKIKCYFLITSEKNLKLTSDYLGPSTTTAFYYGIDDKKIWEAILKCRTIGGHILLPSRNNGINPSKALSGKEGKGISDRADVFLYELKNYYDNKINEKKYNDSLWNAFLQDDKWLKSFKSFEGFCDFFYLKKSFVNENYDIIWFLDKNKTLIEKQDVIEYINNNINAINNRNKEIRKVLLNEGI